MYSFIMFNKYLCINVDSWNKFILLEPALQVEYTALMYEVMSVMSTPQADNRSLISQTP